MQIKFVGGPRDGEEQEYSKGWVPPHIIAGDNVITFGLSAYVASIVDWDKGTAIYEHIRFENDEDNERIDI